MYILIVFLLIVLILAVCTGIAFLCVYNIINYFSQKWINNNAIEINRELGKVYAKIEVRTYRLLFIHFNGYKIIREIDQSYDKTNTVSAVHLIYIIKQMCKRNATEVLELHIALTDLKFMDKAIKESEYNPDLTIIFKV